MAGKTNRPEGAPEPDWHSIYTECVASPRSQKEVLEEHGVTRHAFRSWQNTVKGKETIEKVRDELANINRTSGDRLRQEILRGIKDIIQDTRETQKAFKGMLEDGFVPPQQLKMMTATYEQALNTLDRVTGAEHERKLALAEAGKAQISANSVSFFRMPLEEQKEAVTLFEKIKGPTPLMSDDEISALPNGAKRANKVKVIETKKQKQ